VPAGHTRIMGLIRVREWYRQWERRAAGRFSGWSVRRRWVAFVLAPLLILCCCGGVVGVPVLWMIRETVKAGRGAPAPDAAASGYLTALGYGQEQGLLPLLDDDRQDELLAQWRAYRAAMDATKPGGPARFDFGSLTVGPVDRGRAEVSTDVAATWWGTGGSALSYRSQEFPWRFQTRQTRGGWVISAVQAPAWCGGYVRLDACPR